MGRRGDRNAQSNALVAAATRLQLKDPRVAQNQASRRQDWQAEAWAYFDEVPEIKESIRYRGNQLGKVRLFVAVANPDDPDGDPIPVTDAKSGVPDTIAQAAVDELARLRSRVGGQAEIMRELDMNLEVAGECYLVGTGERTREVKQRDGTMQTITVGEDWQIRSISEVDVKSDGSYVKDAPGTSVGVKVDPELDTIIRIWQRHPQWSKLPDASMRALLGECRALQVLSQQVLAEANSRQSAGAFTVPNELSFGPADSTDPEDGEAGESEDPFMGELQVALTDPITDPSSAASVMPMIIRGPAEYLKAEYLRRIDFSRDTSDSLEKRIEARIARIARGLNLPVEKVMGLMQTTFANAAQVDQDEFDDFLSPAADIGVDALTWAFLTPQLEENPAVPPEWADGTMFVWYDPSALITRPDPAESADVGIREGTISEAAWRRVKSFTEEDAPELDELQRRSELRQTVNPDARAMLTELLTTDGGYDLIRAAVATGGTRTAARPPAPIALAAAAPATSDVGRRLMDLDRDLRTRLVSAADSSMDRALDRAGQILRSRTNGTDYRAQLRTIGPRDGFAHLGRTIVADVFGSDDPLAGAFDDLEQQFRQWGASAQSDAIDLAARVTSGFTNSERRALGARQAQDLDEAWTWMHETLTALAEARLYDPSPVVPELGELDASINVPTGLVRQALARAGGTTGLVSGGGGDAWVTLTDAGTRPAGGIGTGELVRGMLRDNGAQIEAYRWVYGQSYRARPFVPHLHLDDTLFRNFDDDVLINSTGWPPYGHYLPGDHAGCRCDFEPVIVPASDLD